MSLFQTLFPDVAKIQTEEFINFIVKHVSGLSHNDLRNAILQFSSMSESVRSLKSGEEIKSDSETLELLCKLRINIEKARAKSDSGGPKVYNITDKTIRSSIPKSDGYFIDTELGITGKGKEFNEMKELLIAQNNNKIAKCKSPLHMKIDSFFSKGLYLNTESLKAINPNLKAAKKLYKTGYQRNDNLHIIGIVGSEGWNKVLEQLPSKKEASIEQSLPSFHEPLLRSRSRSPPKI